MPEQEIEVGAKAPAFELTDQEGRKIGLKDLEGHWTVLYFYPKDDTPGCTTEACEFTSHLNMFEGLKAKVFGVSPDSPESHREFRKKHHLGLDLLSDPNHKVLSRFGAWGERNMFGKRSEGVIRSTVIIDPKGRIAWRWPKVSPEGHAKEVGAKLTELSRA